jgi:hypothetical protein
MAVTSIQSSKRRDGKRVRPRAGGSDDDARDRQPAREAAVLAGEIRCRGRERSGRERARDEQDREPDVLELAGVVGARRDGGVPEHLAAGDGGPHQGRDDPIATNTDPKTTASRPPAPSRSRSVATKYTKASSPSSIRWAPTIAALRWPLSSHQRCHFAELAFPAGVSNTEKPTEKSTTKTMPSTR